MLKTRLSALAVLAFVAVALSAPRAGAQELRTGDRIRVNTVSGEAAQLIGIYHGSEAGNLVLFTGESVRANIPWDDISRLQLSRGEQSSAGTGALIGGAIGGAFGLTFGLICSGGGDACWGQASAGDVLLATGTLGALGAGVGALIGLAIKSERWQTVPREQWQIRVAPDPQGGVAIGVSLRH